ncbi:MAG: UDP-N-acetylmuramate dehydrogenase [Candidatus Hinthialibacter antarcticus]|nr:UDP-N-acetylmuramate dehydrogenase [Candidatus Hinthialibacter antarcticus]
MTDCVSSIEQTLRDALGDGLRTQVPLAPYTTLQIGGPAEFFLEATSQDQLIAAYRAANELGLRFIFLAGCSNVLIDDAGLKGLVVVNKTQEIHWHDDFTVHVDGGYNLDQFVTDASQRGWADITFAAGIPGSIGGAIVGGAGAFGNLVHEFVLEARVLRKDGGIENVPVESLGITYRNSEARKRGDILLGAYLGKFESGDDEALLENIKKIKEQREVKHPGVDEPSAGSFFKNLPPAEPGGWRTPAGKYLDEAGVKGMRVGNAGVFDKHANIIINLGGATCDDVNQLAQQMAERVNEKFNIKLEREVQYLK